MVVAGVVLLPVLLPVAATDKQCEEKSQHKQWDFQRITEEGQVETVEDWLEKFSPWEVVRHDVVFPVRFFGQVEVNPDGLQKWVGGEVMQALAYDVPIPGYKTKNTYSLRLWEAKAGFADFNLFQFNEGQYESAVQLHSAAQQSFLKHLRNGAKW